LTAVFLFINVERSTGSKCTDFHAKVTGVSQSLSKPPQRIAGSGFEIDVCGEVFRNIFPLQAHQRDVHQVGRGKRTKTSTRRTKGKELMNRVCINKNILITDFVFKQIFFLFLERPSTPVNEGKHLLCVSVAM
jgi:hypothetical protein